MCVGSWLRAAWKVGSLGLLLVFLAKSQLNVEELRPKKALLLSQFDYFPAGLTTDGIPSADRGVRLSDRHHLNLECSFPQWFSQVLPLADQGKEA